MELEFRDIPDIPGYRACSDGTIWGPGKLLPDGTRTSKPLSVQVNRGGYSRVTVRYRKPRRPNQVFAVHSLMLRAFVGPRPDGMQCRHLNGNRRDSRIENLIWGTRAENFEDKIRHGSPGAKIRYGQRDEMVRMRDSGMTFTKIGEHFGVHRTHAHKIIKNHRKIMMQAS